MASLRELNSLRKWPHFLLAITRRSLSSQNIAEISVVKPQFDIKNLVRNSERMKHVIASRGYTFDLDALVEILTIFDLIIQGTSVSALHESSYGALRSPSTS
jgi:hypothetical protein